MVANLEQGVLRTLYKILVRKHCRNTQRRRWEVYAVESGSFLVTSFDNIGV
jgi:hypothetical protein